MTREQRQKLIKEAMDDIQEICDWRDQKWGDYGDRPSSPPAALLYLDLAMGSLRALRDSDDEDDAPKYAGWSLTQALNQANQLRPAGLDMERHELVVIDPHYCACKCAALSMTNADVVSRKLPGLIEHWDEECA